MTVTPDTTEADEALEELLDAVCNADTYDDWDAMRAAAAPILAAIRRQAAADALTEQSRSLGKIAAFMRQQSRAVRSKGDEKGADCYDFTADAYYGSATKLRKAAADKLAEGYEFECAAFSQECDQRVPDAGDYCSRHEPGDDDRPEDD